MLYPIYLWTKKKKEQQQNNINNKKKRQCSFGISKFFVHYKVL